MKTSLLCSVLLGAVVLLAGTANASDGQASVVANDNTTTVEVNLTSKTTVGQAAFQLFGKKKWLCTCSLKSDADGSVVGKWQGNVTARTRIGAEKVGANNACTWIAASP